MSTPAADPSNTVSHLGSHTSPAPTPQVHAHQRKEVAVVFVVDGTARMRPYFKTLYDSYVEPILK